MASLEQSFSCRADPERLSHTEQHTPLSSLGQKQRASRASLRVAPPASDGRQQPPAEAHLPEPGAGHDAPADEPQALNERAVRVIRRVDNKLTGREFGEQLAVADQVQRLIDQATSNLNLCQCYVGWCPWW
jgi:phosphatidylinositol kinase/protein kinase (PI-3  family)